MLWMLGRRESIVRGGRLPEVQGLLQYRPSTMLLLSSLLKWSESPPLIGMKMTRTVLVELGLVTVRENLHVDHQSSYRS